MRRRPLFWGVVGVEVVLLVWTTFAIVTETYATRQQFAELERARNEQRLQQEEWGRLLLEESAFSSPSRVERVAREELQMVEPTLEQIELFAGSSK